MPIKSGPGEKGALVSYPAHKTSARYFDKADGETNVEESYFGDNPPWPTGGAGSINQKDSVAVEQGLAFTQKGQGADKRTAPVRRVY